MISNIFQIFQLLRSHQQNFVLYWNGKIAPTVCYGKEKTYVFIPHSYSTINKFACQWLLNIARVQSKCQKIIDSLKGDTLHKQEYLKSSELSKCEQQLLFAVRCRSYYVKSNYKSQFKSDMTCRSCFDPMSYEDVDHIVKSCLKFKDLIGDEKLSFNDVYGSLQDQIKFWWELKGVSSLCCNDGNSDKILLFTNFKNLF